MLALARCSTGLLRRYMLMHASASDTAYQGRVANLFVSLQVDPARGRTRCSPTRDQTIGFLSLLVDPLAYLQPATTAWDEILSAVGTFLSTSKPRATCTCSSAREEPSGAEVGSSSASYSSSDDDYGTSAVYNPGPLWVGQPCAQRDPVRHWPRACNTFGLCESNMCREKRATTKWLSQDNMATQQRKKVV